MPIGDDVPVEVKDVHKSFGDHKVLDGVTLRIPHGQTLALLGRSGTGKSVLLKLLVGLQAADSGSIRIAGEEITGLDSARSREAEKLNEVRKKTGYLFQQAALYDSLTVEQNVGFPLGRHRDLSEAECRQKVRELLSGVEIDAADFEKMPSEISGGMQKRVGLARALALEPEILLLDEPTAGLDPITAADIGRLITSLKEKRGITSLVVTHDVRGAAAFADYVVLLDQGRIVAEGTFEELRKSTDDFVMRFLADESHRNAFEKETKKE
jgi:phospholipid/cholesterol/gamma-HCH transport system ATP-binding protein